MKPQLTVLLGAGSTLNLGLTGLDGQPIGMPSTADLTARICSMSHTLLPMIHQRLVKKFRHVDFELFLHAIEQLEPIIAGAENDWYRAVLSPFVEIRQDIKPLHDPLILSDLRRAIIAEIYRAIRERNISPFVQPALHRFIHNLEGEFQLSIFTLNYDDIVDGARGTWFDGFVSQVIQRPHGEPQIYSFDARHFNKWREAPEPLLCHLHGSVQFGYFLNDIGMAKYSDPHAAFETIEGIRGGDRYNVGQITSASPIISGLSKAAKLVHNPEPFGYYYRAFINSVLETERLLVIGYGVRDEHIDVWLEQFSKNHGKRKKVVWICCLPGASVGQRTPEINLIELLSERKFVPARNYDNRQNPVECQQCGSNLRLVPSGFPFSSTQTDGEIVNFLR